MGKAGKMDKNRLKLALKISHGRWGKTTPVRSHPVCLTNVVTVSGVVRQRRPKESNNTKKNHRALTNPEGPEIETNHSRSNAWISSTTKGLGEEGAAGYCPKILLPKRATMVLCSFHRSHKEICTRNRPLSETNFVDDFWGPLPLRPLCFYCRMKKKEPFSLEYLILGYHPFQNHYTHEIIVFKLFRLLQLQFSGPTGINFSYSYSLWVWRIFLYSYSSVQLHKKHGLWIIFRTLQLQLHRFSN